MGARLKVVRLTRAVEAIGRRYTASVCLGSSFRGWFHDSNHRRHPEAPPGFGGHRLELSPFGIAAARTSRACTDISPDQEPVEEVVGRFERFDESVVDQKVVHVIGEYD